MITISLIIASLSITISVFTFLCLMAVSASINKRINDITILILKNSSLAEKQAELVIQLSKQVEDHNSIVNNIRSFN